MSSSLSISNLPTELQTAIIRYLDPITLISLSQTSTYYRSLIDPRKPHFIERLLAIECDERYGGPAITFTRFGQPMPGWDSPQWEANRWACASCLKLRPHYAFTNQSLLRLAYRKPPGGARSSSVTSWRPTGNQRKHHRKNANARTGESNSGRGLEDRQADRTTHAHRRSPEEHQLRDRTRIVMGGQWREMPPKHQLSTRLSEFRASGIPAFQEMTLAQFALMGNRALAVLLDQEAQELHRLRAGSNRRQRRCIECRFRRNEFRDQGRDGGPGDVTVLPGRQKPLDTAVDRYFPSISGVLAKWQKKPAYNAGSLGFRLGCTGAYDDPWTMYRIRCPRCERWKESRAFRFGDPFPRWRPVGGNGGYAYTTWDGADVITRQNLQCNHCVAAEEGGREGLGKELSRWLESLLDIESRKVQAVLAYGFGIAARDETSLGFKMTSGLGTLSTKPRESRFTRDDVARLRERRERWMDAELVAASKLAYGTRLRQWVDYYDDAEAMWYCLEWCLMELQGDGMGDLLVEWALETDRPAEC